MKAPTQEDYDKLTQQIAELSANMAKLSGVLARDPAKEFAYVEGNVGATPNFLPCPKMEGFQLLAGALSNARTWTVASQIYPQRWRIRHQARTNALWDSADLTRGALLQFDNTLEFNRPVDYHLTYRVATQPTSYTANAGNVVNTLDVEIPVRYRFFRMTTGIYSSATGFTSIATATLFTFFLPLHVNVLGE